MEKVTRIINGDILTPSGFTPGTILVEGKRIKKIQNRQAKGCSADLVIDAEGGWIIPGLIDLHLHGGNGYDVMDDDPDAVKQIARFHASHGTTSFLATTVPAGETSLLASLRRLHDAVQNNTGGAKLLGIHLEGPYLNFLQRGIHQTNDLAEPAIEQIDRFLTAAGGDLRLVTLAPELPGALSLIAHLSRKRVTCSVGHSNATFAEMEQAIEAGLTYATHTFNGMRGLHQREPGVVGAVLVRPEITAEVIADGLHVHPAVLKLLYKVKGTDGMVLVTDATRAAGSSVEKFEWLGHKVLVHHGACTLSDGTLAGSTLTMWQAVKSVVNMVGIPWAAAIKMASINPARVIGLAEQKGSLAEGKDADLLIIDQQQHVVLTMVEGEIVYSKRVLKH